MDTDVLIDWLRGRATTLEWMNRHVSTGAMLWVSGVSVAEVLSGTSPERRDSRRTLLAAFEYAPFTFAAAQLAGQLRHDHLRTGSSIPLADFIQAAIALTEGLVVATANTRHFPDVETTNPRHLP